MSGRSGNVSVANLYVRATKEGLPHSHCNYTWLAVEYLASSKIFRRHTLRGFLSTLTCLCGRLRTPTKSHATITSLTCAYTATASSHPFNRTLGHEQITPNINVSKPSHAFVTVTSSIYHFRHATKPTLLLSQTICASLTPHKL